MANDRDFVEKSLGELKADGFEPNAERARLLLRARSAPRSRRWMWAAVPATAVLAIAMLAAPGARAMVGMSPASLDWAALHEVLLEHWMGLVHMVHGTGRAPDFALTDASGQTVRLSDYRGKVVLLNFWATWCAPCKAEVPWFVDLQKTYKDDVAVLGVSFDEDGWKSVRPFIEERHVNYPVMLATPELPDQYRKIESLPATLMIDRKGRIAGTHLGLSSKAQYEALIREQL